MVPIDPPQSPFSQVEVLKKLLALAQSEAQANEKREKTQQWMTKVSIVLGAITSTLVPFGIALISARQSEIGVKQDTTLADVRQLASQIDELKAARQPVITSPSDGGAVELKTLVAGTTPLIGRNHYIVVTPVETDVAYVQDDRAPVDASGSLRGFAQFGQEGNGIQKDFIIRLLATGAVVPPGELREVPSDATFSEGIRVTRQK